MLKWLVGFARLIANRKRDDEALLQNAIFLSVYARKYGMSESQVSALVERKELASKMVEGLWVVEDRPPGGSLSNC